MDRVRHMVKHIGKCRYCVYINERLDYCPFDGAKAPADLDRDNECWGYQEKTKKEEEKDV
jgi:hypothetical protein